MESKAEFQCKVNQELLLSIIACLTQSDYLDGELLKKLEDIANEIGKEISAHQEQEARAKELAQAAKLEQEKGSKKASGK